MPILFLAACNTSDVSESTLESGFSYAADQTISTAAASTTPTSYTGTLETIVRDYDADTQTPSGQKSVSLRLEKGSGDSFVAVIDAFGRSTQFTQLDISNTSGTLLEKTLDDGSLVFLLNHYDAWANSFSGQSNYKYVVSYSTSLTDSAVSRRDVGVGVTGLLTPVENLPQTGEASFQGDAVLVSYATGTENNFTLASGDVTLNADFGSSQISGSMGNFGNSNGSLPASFGIRPTTMSNGTFQSTLDLTSGALTTGGSAAISSSNLQGAIYGNAAQELAGTFTFEGTDTNAPGGENMSAIGTFAAKQ